MSSKSIEVGALGLAVGMPWFMLLLSLSISVLLRRIAVVHGGATDGDALFRTVGSWSDRISPIDGRHFIVVEKLARTVVLLLALAAPPLVCVAVIFALYYPVWSTWVIDVDVVTWMEALALLPHSWIALFLTVLTLHQSMVVFGAGEAISRSSRSHRASDRP